MCMVQGLKGRSIMAACKSYCVLLVFFLIGLSQVWAERNHILIKPNNVSSNTTEASCLEQCYSLQNILTHHDRFFTSNTTIELLPGQHLINESFGNIVIEGVEHFSLIGMNGSTIQCLTHGTLGLYFLNVMNVSLSSIHISHCSGDNSSMAQFIHIIQQLYLIRFRGVSILDKCTLAFVTSSNITLSKMAIEHGGPGGTGLLVVGVRNNFHLSQSFFSHNEINCAIITHGLKNHSYSSSTHQYRITDSRFAFGYVPAGTDPKAKLENEMASGISTIFSHKVGVIDLLLSNITLLNNTGGKGNLLFAVRNCDLFARPINGQTIVAINNLVSEATGGRLSNKGLVVDSWSVCPPSQSLTRGDLLNFNIDNSKFIKSCIVLTLYVGYLVMRGTVVERASCTCDYAFIFVSEKLVCSDNHRPRCTIEDLSVTDSCGSKSLMKTVDSNITFQGRINFQNNKGTVLFQNSVIEFDGNTTVQNSSSRESPFRLVDTFLTIKGSALFENNMGGECGGMTLIRSEIDDSYRNRMMLTFTGNLGHNGGALAFYDVSKLNGWGSLIIENNDASETFAVGTMVFENNIAHNYGGAIFVDDASYQSGKYNNRFVLKCFSWSAVTIEFQNNSAALAGDDLFGGWVDFCDDRATLDGFNVFQLNNSIGNLSRISSNPSRVCLCIDSTPQCNILNYKHIQPLSPGQTLQIQAVTVGQRFGTVPSTVIAEYVNSSVKIDEIQHVQNVGRYCTTLNYSIRSPNSEENISLSVHRNFIPEPDITTLQTEPTFSYYKKQLLVFDKLSITLTISKCPLGYSFDGTSNTCTCQRTLTSNGIDCYIQNQTIIRRNQMWINVTFVHTDPKIGNPGVVLHHNCPFNYCKNLNQQYLDLRYPDEQCAFGRSGILCGECPQNYSHVFGTSNCKKCSNVWTILVLSLFILTGIGLVALLIILNLTVSVGTINGLIFYAHIVRANQAAFFPPQMTNTFLSWFIAWLNLDLGIEMCFFDGLDAYTKTWL